MKIFDFHAHSHNPTEFTQSFQLTESMIFTKAHAYIPNHTGSMEENIAKTIEYYDQHQIIGGLISGPHTDTWIEQHPDRFFRSFRFTQEEVDKQLIEFEQGIKDGNIFGLGELGFSYAGIKLDTKKLYPFYEICEQYNVPVLFHAGLNGPNPTRLMPHWRVKYGDPLLLEPVLGSFSNLNLVIAHFGYPFVDQTNYMLASYTNCYADLSVINWMMGEKLYHRILEEAVDAVGSDRLLYGSDQMIWPQMISLSVERTKAAAIDQADLEQIFLGTAQQLLPFLS